MKKHLQFGALPLFLAISPILFLYSHNGDVLHLTNLLVPVFLVVVASLALYSLFYIIKRNSISASLSASLVIGTNYLYGTIYKTLTKLDLFPVEHHLLLPIVIYAAFYSTYLLIIFKVEIREAIQKIATVMATALVVFNIIIAIPTEIQKANLTPVNSPATVEVSPNLQNQYPDVYYIILDEYAGFEVVRNYWQKEYIDDFEQFLKENGFVIVENARSVTGTTTVEIASRLNLKQFSAKTDSLELIEAIIDNKVMKLFKEYGYTTVAFNGPFPEYNADYNISFSANAEDIAVGTGEFNKVLIERSFLFAFSDLLQRNDSSARRLSSINLTFEKISDLDKVPSPKLVIAHILFPHLTFVSDKDGNPLDPMYQYNWNYYIGQHEYATKQTQALVSRLLEQADPENPPVILLQSDHGARNLNLHSEDSIELTDYPQDNYHSILFAMHLPGVDISDLTDSIPPIETFRIVMKKYFNADVDVDMSEGVE